MKQAFKKTKETYTKIVAAVMAALLGTTGAVMLVKNKTKDSTDLPEGTSISQEAEENEKLYLSEDFDINNDKEVEERARAIYELLEDELKKNITANDIKNIIYVVNNSSEKTSLKSSDDIQQLLISLGNVYSNGVSGYVNKLAGATNNANGVLVHSYMFFASSNAAKKYSLKLGVILNKQVENIKNNVSDKVLADEYYKLFKEISENKELTSNEKSSLLNAFKAYNPLFTTSKLLSKENVEELDKNNELAISTDEAGISIAKKGTKATDGKSIDIITKKDDDCDEADKKNKENTKEGNHYGLDTADANKYSGNNSSSDKKEESAGGKVIGNEEQVISGGDKIDTIITEETVANIVEDAHEEVEEGGQVLEEYTEVIYSDANIDSPTKVLK